MILLQILNPKERGARGRNGAGAELGSWDEESLGLFWGYLAMFWAILGLLRTVWGYLATYGAVLGLLSHVRGCFGVVQDCLGVI